METDTDTTDSGVDTNAEPTTDPTSLVTSDNPSSDSQDTQDTQDTAPQNQFLSEIKEKFGADFTGKYADDEAAKKGLVEAARLVGQRNEEAEMWRQFQQMIAGKEQQLAALLDGKDPTPPPAPKQEPAKSEEWSPKSFDELRYLASKLFDDSGAIRKDADRSLVDRYTMANQRLQETAFDLAFNPDKVRERLLGGFKDDVLKETTKTLEEKQAQQQMDNEFRKINERYASELYADDSKTQLTAFGEQVLANWNRLIKKGAPKTPDFYQEAIDSALANRPKPNPTKPTNPNAVRKPALNPAPTDGPSLAERMTKPGFKLSDLVRERLEKQKA